MEAILANIVSIKAEIRDRIGEPASRWFDIRLCIAVSILGFGDWYVISIDLKISEVLMNRGFDSGEIGEFCEKRRVFKFEKLGVTWKLQLQATTCLDFEFESGTVGVITH